MTTEGEGVGRNLEGRKETVEFPTLPFLPAAFPSAVVSPLAPVSRPLHDLPLGFRGWFHLGVVAFSPVFNPFTSKFKKYILPTFGKRNM